MRRTCAVCGQDFDLRNFAHSYHHTEQPHEPLPLIAR